MCTPMIHYQECKLLSVIDASEKAGKVSKTTDRSKNEQLSTLLRTSKRFCKMTKEAIRIEKTSGLTSAVDKDPSLRRIVTGGEKWRIGVFSEELTINDEEVAQRKANVKKLEQKNSNEIEETLTSPKIPEMSKKRNVNEFSEAHLDPKSEEVKLRAVKNHYEEPQDFNTELKKNIDRILEKGQRKHTRV
ncbi:hypothetical protein TNCV_641241 [Trichonephila clavipes]|nr:hypothetical protein TNCV_641241 [Trichonephila clavipes]